VETLILVDFDNLLGFWQAHDPKTLPLMGAAGSADWWQPDRPETTAVLVGPGELPDLVVAVALNTTSALPSASGRPAPTMSYIRRLAASFGPRLYPNAKVGVEVGLVLRYPDAVDDLLVALVHQAALPEDVGVLKEVLLVSRDGGLVGRLGGRLREHSHRRNGIVHTWRPLHSTKRILRLYQTPDPPGAGTATEPALFRSTRVQSAAQARAVSTWPLDITANADLADMARLVEAHPSILTQIGATTPSLRGLARLVRSDAPAPSIPTGACAATDGLEFHRPQDPSPGQVTVSATETSPLGPGAVYLPDQAATVRCATRAAGSACPPPP
jgi:hypothetical protein